MQWTSQYSDPNDLLDGTGRTWRPKAAHRHILPNSNSKTHELSLDKVFANLTKTLILITISY